MYITLLLLFTNYQNRLDRIITTTKEKYVQPYPMLMRQYLGMRPTMRPHFLLFGYLDLMRLWQLQWQSEMFAINKE